ncbi:16S rRNA (guanine(966)-N(2))-methyltransferase RsmD [Aliikangiella sp. G2MR2-5]|uniref:16S rRNA (guanine(966)-N(2))-methyltransferase RsmD n=1 Tax=Aliikangiella sp. G2MR2-5 TaxID=2788943 RepID=UPI0018AAB373|nr:16S rRNA (guanine(966)-N(2))-methyltransferase RsmD [Aliikangiella sp. G2MR2-5]
MHQSKNKTSTSQSKHQKGVVRIIGGEMRGRKIHFSQVSGLRPTLDRIRETLFNWLAHSIHGATCLDLFAGSGAIGFEAASRGAKKVTLVEKHRKVVSQLKENASKLQTNTVYVVQDDASDFLKRNKEEFNLVFLDPPFNQGLLSETFNALVPHLSPDAIVYIEQERSEQAFVPPTPWQTLKFKQTGSFSYALYQRPACQQDK